MGPTVGKKKKKRKKGPKISTSSWVYNWLCLSERPFLCAAGRRTLEAWVKLYTATPPPPSLPSLSPSLPLCPPHFSASVTSWQQGSSPDCHPWITAIMSSPWFSAPAGCGGGETFSLVFVEDSTHHLFMMQTRCWVRLLSAGGRKRERVRLTVQRRCLIDGTGKWRKHCTSPDSCVCPNPHSRWLCQNKTKQTTKKTCFLASLKWCLFFAVHLHPVLKSSV